MTLLLTSTACAMCGLTPGTPGITGDRGDDSAPGYYLCLDRSACLERAIAAQEAARDAARGAPPAPAAEAPAEVPPCDCQQDPAEPEAPVQPPDGDSGTGDEAAAEGAGPAAGDGCLIPPADGPEAAPAPGSGQPPAGTAAAGDDPAEAEAEAGQ